MAFNLRARPAVRHGTSNCRIAPLVAAFNSNPRAHRTYGRDGLVFCEDSAATGFNIDYFLIVLCFSGGPQSRD